MAFPIFAAALFASEFSEAEGSLIITGISSPLLSSAYLHQTLGTGASQARTDELALE